MTRKFVYLAGPVLHVSEMDANNWRRGVARSLDGTHLTGISPLRNERPHGDSYEIESKEGGGPNVIWAKNEYDVRTCDAVLAYLPAESFSRGTYVEMGYARALGKPIFLVSEDAETRNHPIVRTIAGWVYADLDEAVEAIVALLNGYVGGKNV